MLQSLLLTAWLLVALAACRVAPPLSNAVTRYPAIEGLRGLLALMVVWSHAVRMPTLMPREGVPYWSPFFADHQAFHTLGSLAVSLFFCITGFLFWERKTPSDLGSFLQGRIRRLAPAYLALAGAMMLLTAGLSSIGGAPANWFYFGKQLLSFLTFGLTDLTIHPTAVVTMGMAWSLAYEWAFYLSLPLLWVLRSYSRVLPHVVFVLGCQYALPTGPRNIALFLWAGMLAAESTPFLIQKLSVPIRVGLSWLGLPLIGALSVWGGFGFKLSFIPAVLALFLTVVLAVPGRGPLAGFAPLSRLGEMAYSLYLTHGFVLLVLFLPLLPIQDSLSPRLFECWVAIATIAALGMARLWYHFFERTFIHAKH